VLDKETTYTEEDFALMKKHPELGYRYARDNFELPTRSFLAILQHHERYDGTGYPLGKKGEEINEFARIVAVADVYDALTSDKPYRKPMMPVAAFKHIISNNKKAFDPRIVKLFFDKVSPYPIGFTVHLPDGRDVIVAENIEGQPLYPKVKVIAYKGVKLEQPYITILE
jgi:HD-GYP domain-containing protein (c-di-GMP phosphodiesterase class II)